MNDLKNVQMKENLALQCINTCTSLLVMYILPAQKAFQHS